MIRAPIYGEVEVPPSADLVAIIRAAGGDPKRADYTQGTNILYVADVTQEALEAAALKFGDPLYARRIVLKAQAGAEQERRIAIGLPFRGKMADIDEVATGRMTSVAVAIQAGLVTSAISWRMKDNSAMELDPTGVVALAGLTFAYVDGLRRHYWSLVDAIQAAADADELASINVLVGWPAPPVEGAAGTPTEPAPQP